MGSKFTDVCYLTNRHDLDLLGLDWIAHVDTLNKLLDEVCSHNFSYESIQIPNDTSKSNASDEPSSLDIHELNASNETCSHNFSESNNSNVMCSHDVKSNTADLLRSHKISKSNSFDIKCSAIQKTAQPEQSPIKRSSRKRKKPDILQVDPSKKNTQDKFGQLYSTEFKDPLSRTSSMFVEDRIALSESAYGVAEYTRLENVSRQVQCSFLLTKFKVVKPKTEAPSANKPKSTLRKPKEKKDTKLKVKTTKRPKATVMKKPVTKTLKKHASHIRRGIEDGVEKGALVRVVNKSKGASGSCTEANAILRQIICSWKQSKSVNVLLEEAVNGTLNFRGLVNEAVCGDAS
ncbi:unnamed protein product [Schistosoma margrebowiei]|uniref:Uncharacterized protein n=1 Tax=Schistosoma margrebowiei TaxID=48269 RepID=A0A183LZH7_9TREM|nr:unnamed protein product [Schistosoma margrebowiei]